MRGLTHEFAASPSSANVATLTTGGRDRSIPRGGLQTLRLGIPLTIITQRTDHAGIGVDRCPGKRADELVTFVLGQQVFQLGFITLPSAHRQVWRT